VDRLKREQQERDSGSPLGLRRDWLDAEAALTEAIAEIERLQTENTAMLAGAFAHDAACHYPEDKLRRVIEQMRDAWRAFFDWYAAGDYEQRWYATLPVTHPVKVMEAALAAAEEALR
jgi:hypothetical protein